MGLDTVAAYSLDDVDLTEADLQAFKEVGIPQVGIISADEIGIFRGKVFDAYIRRITGVSLYQEWIPPETVVEMYQAIKAYELSKWQEDGDEMLTQRMSNTQTCASSSKCAASAGWGWWRGRDSG